jgi:peroxiredoxin
MRITRIVVVGCLALPSPAQERPATDQVEAAMLECLADGPHHRRSEPLAAIGASAVDPLARIVRDSAQPPDRRILAAQALARLGASPAREPLREVANAKDSPRELREAAEESLYLLGETSAVDARVENILVEYMHIPIARAAAAQRLAHTYAATGRFSSAARVSRQAIEATDHDERRRFLSYDLACYEALAGNREAALDAVRSAIKSARIDLDWMAKDGDLRMLHQDSEFLALIAAAKEKLAASAPKAPDPEQTPEQAEYERFRRGYWDGDFETYIAASNWYWEGYREWLETEGREHGDETKAAWKARKGPAPENPTPGWIARFRERLAKAEGTPVATRIRRDLLTIFANEDMAEDWTALFLAMAEKTPEEAALGDHAQHGALYVSERAGRREEMLAALRSVIEAHPRAPSAAGFRLALAEERREADDDAAARALYAAVIEIYPNTSDADEARGALYEMDHLAVGRVAPDFEADDIHGHRIRLADLRGKVVLLDFWATWCGPCLGELPHVKRLHADFAGREDFVLIGVSLDGDGIALVDFLREQEIHWPQVCGLSDFDDPLARLYNVRGIPDAFLIDREGKIVVRGLRGEELHDAVRKALDEGG